MADDDRDDLSLSDPSLGISPEIAEGFAARGITTFGELGGVGAATVLAVRDEKSLANLIDLSRLSRRLDRLFENRKGA